jgi:enolase
MSNTRIKQVKARQIYDSRANPTVEVDVILESGVMGRGLVPSGASTGKHEAVELRDNDPQKLGGKSVLTAVKNVNEIIGPKLIGLDALDQAFIDNLLLEIDGTPNKANMGANAILGVSMATAWAAANSQNIPLYRYLGGSNARTLPVPMIQIIGGGKHANGSIDIQDYLVVPVGAQTFTEGIEMVINVYHATRKVFAEQGKPVSVADEGGFWPTFTSNTEGLDLLVAGIEKAGYKPGKDIAIALDIASSHFYEDGKYCFSLENREMSAEEFADILVSWVDKYPIISIEDGMAEDDWEGWKVLTKKMNSRIQLVGDDLFVTNINRIKRGLTEGVGNGVLIKLNQIGTLTETMQAIELTKNAGYLPIVSARSGETEDAIIVHLAIATGAGQLKVGSVARSERGAKWNECIRIEEELGAMGLYPGKELFDRVIKRS